MWSKGFEGIRTLIAGVAGRDRPLDDDHGRNRSVNQSERGAAFRRSSPALSHRIEMDAREGLSPSSRGLQPRTLILGHRAMCCQGGARTPAFRVTAGRLSARLPGIALRVATGNRTPISELRARRLDQWTIATRAEVGRLERGLATHTCFRDRLLIQPGHFQVCLAGTIRTCDLCARNAVLWIR